MFTQVFALTVRFKLFEGMLELAEMRAPLPLTLSNLYLWWSCISICWWWVSFSIN
jgi:hypothetical protein